MPPGSRARVLIVDGDPSVRLALRRALGGHYDVLEVGDGVAAVACLEYEPVDVMTLDLLLPGMDGFEVLEHVRALPRRLPVIVISGINTSWTAATAMRLGAVDYITKPFDDAQVLTAVAESLDPSPRRGGRWTSSLREPRLLFVGVPVGVRATLAVLLGEPDRLEAVTDVGAALTRLKGPIPDTIVTQVSADTSRAFPEPVSRLRRAFPDGLIIAMAAGGGTSAPRARHDGALTLLTAPPSVGALLHELAASFPRRSGRMPELSDATRRVVDHLSEHYAGASVDGLGRMMRMAPRALSARFRRELGTSLRAYLRALRIEVVKILLAETADGLETIAMQVGWNDASHLSRVFMAHAGCRPGAYRRRQRRADPAIRPTTDSARILAGDPWSALVDRPVPASDPFVTPTVRVSGEERVAFDVAACTGELRPPRFFDTMVADALDDVEALGPSPVGVSLARFTEAIDVYLGQRGVSTRNAVTLTTSGTSASLGMLARALARAGDVVAVEHPTWHVALAAFAATGLRVLAIPVDDEGIRVDLLEPALRRHRVRFLYIQPAFQNPTGVTLSAARRRQLFEVARRLGTLIVEDDFAAELAYDDVPPPLRTAGEEDHVVYLKSFSKVLSPAARVAVMVAPRQYGEALRAAQHGLDPFPSALAQSVVARCLHLRQFRRHLERVRELLEARWQVMNGALETRMPDGVRWTRPGGGVSTWLELPAPLTTLEILVDVARSGVGFAPGSVFCLEGSGQRGARLAFGATPPLMIERGVRQLARAIRERLRESGRSPFPGATTAP